MDTPKIEVKCTNPECGKSFLLTPPSKPGYYSVVCNHCNQTVNFEVPDPKVAIKCDHCGHEFTTKRMKPQRYMVDCPKCKQKVRFKVVDLSSPAQVIPSEPQVKPAAKPQDDEAARRAEENRKAIEAAKAAAAAKKAAAEAEAAKKAAEAQKEKPKPGKQPDGNYLLECDNCHVMMRINAKDAKPGDNEYPCPKCQNKVHLYVEPSEDELLKCTQCEHGHVKKLQCDDEVYTTECDNEYCDARYSVTQKDGKIIKVALLTNTLNAVKTEPMCLVSGSFFSKKRYDLKRGTHTIGRTDADRPSDFSFKDPSMSRQSVKIDVNLQGSALKYKLTVLNALNPVYHNNNELRVGDKVYLTYGDTLKLGQTLIRLEKSKR